MSRAAYRIATSHEVIVEKSQLELEAERTFWRQKAELYRSQLEEMFVRLSRGEPVSLYGRDHTSTIQVKKMEKSE